MENEFMTAEEFIKGSKFHNGFHSISSFNEQSDDYVITITRAMLAIKMARKEERNKAIEAFREFVEDYCHEAGFNEISNSSEHYIEAFKYKLENKNEYKRTSR